MDREPNAAPFNPLPPVVWLLALPMIAMEIVLSLAERGLVGGAGGVGWRMQAVERFAFSPDILVWMWGRGDFPAEHLMRFVTYPFVHAGFTHALFVVVFLLALGKMVGEVFRPWAVGLVFLGAAVAGAAAYTVLGGMGQVLIGGYPAVYGLIGAFTFLLWMRLAGAGAARYRAFSLIGVIMAIQLLFGLLGGGGRDWIADLAGFATGFALSFVVSPGGVARVRARLRQR
ncbi:rhomboid family intramembrane serine protease [Ruixingdingia sedimenti]|uniref:Rhomboid family intramembrane serine protease n=1 Tax=Ruixingdingia sedimenti TaxID=3073604 RepID=A0ABU1FB61_9RHOB|nr:rhomboid family intramembrane serine protease [Xinfangfangia sp. LG-4]MDR5653679.1 rhomboid family intramembrane serine protease [Xinfangfangia sp. LG-4]